MCGLGKRTDHSLGFPFYSQSCCECKICLDGNGLAFAIIPNTLCHCTTNLPYPMYSATGVLSFKHFTIPRWPLSESMIYSGELVDA